MTSFSRKIFRIAELVKLDKDRMLVLQPKFQRRPAWEEKARSYLIDTVVRGFPMPKIYLRRAAMPKSGVKGYEVVDGQQRLRAVLDFYKGKLQLSRRHNADLGDANFSTLPEPSQRAFLDYEISAEVIEGASDPEVWGMFERLNSYTLTLNLQERRNAQFFGYFKQTAYKLAAEQAALDAWKALGVFGDRQIARMKEVELASDVLVAIVEGISDITDITDAYKKFDDEFPQRAAAEETFRKSLSLISTHLAPVVRKTRFRRKTRFYSLMVASADTLVGIPDGMGPSKPRPWDEVRRRMLDLDAALQQASLAPGLSPLRDALSRQTSHVPPRELRHQHFFDLLTLSKDDWAEKWKALNSAV